MDWSLTIHDEAKRIAPHVQTMKDVALRFDPQARFEDYPGLERESWRLDVYVSNELSDDPDLAHALSGASMNILEDFHLDLIAIPLPRESYFPGEEAPTDAEVSARS